MSRRKSKKKKQNSYNGQSEAAAQAPVSAGAPGAEAAADAPAADSSPAAVSEAAEPQAEPVIAADAGQPKKAVVKVVAKPRNMSGGDIQTDQYGNPLPERGPNAPRRRGEPVRTVTPADIQKPQVSFMNSIAHVEAENLPKQTAAAGSTAQAYDHAVFRRGAEEDSAYSPKIRRMSDSTRAKELRKRRSSGEKLPYGKDTPTPKPQTLPASKLRSKRQSESPEVWARIPEPLKAHPLDDPQPVNYISKAEHTQINLSADNRPENNDVNIDIRYQDERRERTDLPKKAKELSGRDDNAAIRNDLTELKTNLSLRTGILGALALLSGLFTPTRSMPCT